MKLKVSCQICGKLLMILEKDDISQDDIDTYQSSCSCEDDGNQSIVAAKSVD